MRIEHDKVRTRISVKPEFCMSIDHSKMVCVRLKETLHLKFCLHLCSKCKFRFPTLLWLFIMQKALQFPFLLFLSLSSCCCVWMVCQKFFLTYISSFITQNVFNKDQNDFIGKLANVFVKAICIVKFLLCEHGMPCALDKIVEYRRIKNTCEILLFKP